MTIYVLAGSTTTEDTGTVQAAGSVNTQGAFQIAGTDFTATANTWTNTQTLSNSPLVLNTTTASSVVLEFELNGTPNGVVIVALNDVTPNITFKSTISNSNYLQIYGNIIQTANSIIDDGSGNLTVAGYAYVKGKNRSYQQNLTASTTTSTTPTLLGSSIGFTPKFSGYLVVSATIRASNNTIGDGITLGAYQGTTSGALTTLLDSETYTQEGLASNSHTFVLHYELSGQAVGTATYLSLAYNAVTGGTASAKIVSFSVQEV